MKTCCTAILKPFARREFSDAGCNELLPIGMAAKMAVPKVDHIRTIHRRGRQTFSEPVDVSNLPCPTQREVTQSARLGAPEPVVGFIPFHLSDSFRYRLQHSTVCLFEQTSLALLKKIGKRLQSSIIYIQRVAKMLMNEVKLSSPTPGRSRRWLRILVWTFSVLIFFLVVGWFVVTSPAFLKGIILPQVSKAMNATVTVDDASISPLSHIVLQNLKVQTTGSEPLVAVKEIRLSYHAFDIVRGNINVDEVTIDSPTINLVQNADGTSNLDPLLKSSSSQKKEEKNVRTTKIESSKPLQVFLKRFALIDATVRQTKNFSDGRQSVTEASNVNVTLENVKNSGTGKLQLSADVKTDNQPPAPAASGSLQAKITGAFDFTLAADLKTASVKGNTQFDVTQAGGALKDLSGFGANFDCDVTPTDIAQIALRFQKSGAQLGELRVSGPFDMQKAEGRLSVEVLSLDKQVLNIFGAASGIDFGGTTVNSTNQIELTKSGSLIAASGQLGIANLQLTRAGQTTPTLDAYADYNVTVDSSSQSAQLSTLTFTATQNHQPLAHAELSSPMNLSWSTNGEAVGDSTLEIGVTGLNLADWKPFLGEAVSKGEFILNAKLSSHSGGKQLAFNLDSQITNITANFNGNQIAQAGIDLRVKGEAADFKQFKLDEFHVGLAQQDHPLFTVTGSGMCEPAAQTADIQFQLQAMLPGLAKFAPQANANLSSGTIDLTGHVTQKEKVQTVSGKLSVAALTGQVGKNTFQNYGVGADLDVSKSDDQIQINRAAGTLTADGNAGGSFEISGNYDSEKKTGQVTAKLAGLDQNGLRPFLEPLLADKKLDSIAINADTSAQLGPENDAAIKMNLQLTNLVVSDPTGQFPATPLETKLQLDASVSKQVANLRALQITLTPTDRAKNELQITGKVDFSKTNAIAGNLKFTADTMDMTRYYDLFSGKSKPVATTSQSTNAAPAPVSNKEPDAMNLPVGDFIFDATVNRFYLREVDVANFQMTTKINGSHVALKPCQFTLNGAPVNVDVDLNLGVPGYEYNVNFNASNVPIAPLANSFSPTYKDKAKGDLAANAQIKGAGITGTSLQKSLVGNVSIVLTNADVQLVGPKVRKFILAVASIATIAHISGLDQLANSSLNQLDAHVKMGDGKIVLTQFNALLDAIGANTSGQIDIAPVLNNSPINDWPIHFLIGRSSLPSFIELAGTLGSPSPKLAITGVDSTKIIDAGKSFFEKMKNKLQNGH